MQEINCLTTNINIKSEDDFTAKSKSMKPGEKGETQRPSLFREVLKRRKSRQSTYAPGVVDFNYAGDSAGFAHLITKREEVGYPNKVMLNFEMNLR